MTAFAIIIIILAAMVRDAGVRIAEALEKRAAS
jgi:hypothetical protein